MTSESRFAAFTGVLQLETAKSRFGNSIMSTGFLHVPALSIGQCQVGVKPVRHARCYCIRNGKSIGDRETLLQMFDSSRGGSFFQGN